MVTPVRATYLVSPRHPPTDASPFGGDVLHPGYFFYCVDYLICSAALADKQEQEQEHSV